MSTFDCLSNELIICIFDYLEPAQNFQSFFHCNARLRKLVKRYVTYNRRELDKDIKRYSTLHSWYKHLNFVNGGETFYMMPLQGEQERYSFDPRISDFVGIHWHFSLDEPMPLLDGRLTEISRKYSIKLNPLFSPYGSSFGVFTQNASDFIRHYYPSQFEVLERTIFSESYMSMIKNFRYPDDVILLTQYICENEPKRLRNVIQQAAYCIWKEIQVLENVNILDINYKQKSAGFVTLVTFK